MKNKERSIFKQMLDAVNPYNWITWTRNRMFDYGMLESRKFPVATICIGNISVGGTGKTPHTEYLIESLHDNHKVAVLSRGYGRKSKGYIKAGTDTTMEALGDEPFQIKNKYPEIAVAVCEKRVEGIERLMTEEKGLQTILLDDAYQHRYVKAGLNILLIDMNRPVWCDNVMPFGRLRESIAGIKRADIVIMTKCGERAMGQHEEICNRIRSYKDIPVYFSAIRYGRLYPLFGEARQEAAITPGSSILLVTGIAKPQLLKEEIEKRGAKVTLMQYGDHHNFTTAEIDEIAKRFGETGSTMIVTTEKDATRLLHRTDLPQEIRDNIYALPIEMAILNGEEELFNQNIYNYVTENSRDS